MIFQIKEKYREIHLQKCVDVCFICPICKIAHARSFVVSSDTNNDEIDKIIEDSIKAEFYQTHVLDCVNKKLF
jgi:hypothetical protein